jgi:hypothetical protein
MTSNMKAGQVWQVKGSPELAVVVFVWDDEFLGEDVRVLPVFVGPGNVGLATERDVVIPTDDNSLGAALLVNCWNGQVISRSDLGVCLGVVSERALDAARAIEMLDLEAETAANFSHWVGPVLEHEDDPRLNARRDYFIRWQDIRAGLALFQGAVRMTFSAPHNAGRLFTGLNGLTGESSAFTVLIQSADRPIGANAASVAAASGGDDMTLQAA